MKSVAVWGIGLSLLVSACAMATVKPAVSTTPTPAFVAWSQRGNPDKRICVLPFTDQTNTEGLAAQVRESFAGHLTIRRFSDAELYALDARLDALGGGWRQQSAPQLGRMLGCDALVYGEVTTASRLYLGIYAQLTLAGAIRVVDAASGQPVVEESHTTTFRTGGVPLSLLGVVPNAVINLRSMTDAQMVRAIDDLGRHLADKVPDLPAAPPVQRVAAPALPVPAPVTPIGTTRQAPARTEQERYRVQVAAFSTPAEAQQAARLLRDKGYRPAIIESTGSDRSWHRVMVGPFLSIHEAQQAGAQIQKSLRFTPVVMRTSDR